MEKILVTGSTGFLGSYLVKELSKKFEVKCFIRNKNKVKKLPKDVDVFIGDITKKKDCIFAVKNVDLVCHLAAQMREKGVPKQQYWNVNVEGTKNIIEASIKENVEQFIHCSTASIIGPVNEKPLNEEYTHYECDNIYKLTKTEAEKIVLKNKENISITIISPEFIYGPNCFHYLSLFRAIKEKKIFILGNGKNLHQPTYVTDVVQGFLLAIKNKRAMSEKFIIAGKENITSKDLILKIADEMNLKFKPLHLPLWPIKLFSSILPLHPGTIDFFTKNHIYNISKAEKILGYKPKVNLEEGIKNTVEWFNKILS